MSKSDIRLNREWSNDELTKFASLFTGDVVNVSGWKDEDKEDGYYGVDYFKNAKSYTITNYKSARGWQDKKGEIELNLEDMLPKELAGKFDVVFNHTTLEHIYHFQTAFANMCAMTRDILILVVPFLQLHHSASDKSYLDYWRFSKDALERMCKRHGLEVLYLSENNDGNDCIYLFLIASKKPNLWKDKI